MSDYNINIIGYGYVGGAIGHLCKLNNIRFNVHDTFYKDATYYFHNLNEMIINSEACKDPDSVRACIKQDKLNVYFICVPTPSKDNGNDDDNHGDCDTSIVMSVVNQLNSLVTQNSVIILKSTVTPGTSIDINKTITNDKIKFMFCPEFLRESSFLDDIANADFVLLGINDSMDESTKECLTKVFKNLYGHKMDEIDVIFEDYTVCEMFKYTVNVFLATKVWYFNEIYQICNKFDIQYNKLRNLFRLEERIGESHTQVPGPDGSMGFGGKCLVKESKGMARLQERLGLPNEIMTKILLRNKNLRNGSI